MRKGDIDAIREEAAKLAASDILRAHDAMRKLEAARAAMSEAGLALHGAGAPTASGRTFDAIRYTLDIIIEAMHEAGARS